MGRGEEVGVDASEARGLPAPTSPPSASGAVGPGGCISVACVFVLCGWGKMSLRIVVLDGGYRLPGFGARLGT